MSEQVVEQGDVFKLIPDLEDNSAHCAVVDYPWQFEHQNGTGGFEQPSPEDRQARDKRVSDIFEMESDNRFGELLEELSRVLTDGSWLLCMADDRFQDVVRDAIRDSEFILRRNWAWSPGGMGMGSYGRVSHYPIPVATLGETDRYVTDRGTLYTVSDGRSVDYPTGKPAALYRQLLEEPVIESGGRLLEPFCGSGPGAAVASERDLQYWGCDVDEDAVERTEKRLQQTTVSEWGDLEGFANGD